MDKAIETLLTRRSCRSYVQDKPIPKEAMDTILKCACYAPSAMNRQTWQFTVVQDKEKIARLAKAVGAAVGNENYNFYLPAAIVLVSNDTENGNGLADCACAINYMFLSAHALGIASCWINQLKDVMDDKAVREILDSFGVPGNHIVWATAALGYAAAPIDEKEKNLNVVKYA